MCEQHHKMWHSIKQESCVCQLGCITLDIISKVLLTRTSAPLSCRSWILFLQRPSSLKPISPFSNVQSQIELNFCDYPTRDSHTMGLTTPSSIPYNNSCLLNIINFLVLLALSTYTLYHSPHAWTIILALDVNCWELASNRALTLVSKNISILGHLS